MSDFYLDESGNTGDALKIGASFDSFSQPIFCLSCIGVDNPDLDEFIKKIKNKYHIQANELKSTKIYKSKPKLILEVIEFIVSNDLPVFIEVVDKKYHVVSNIVNLYIINEFPSYFFGKEFSLINGCADFIYNFAPDLIFSHFIELCKSPSKENLLKHLKEINSFSNEYLHLDQYARFISESTANNIENIKKLPDGEDSSEMVRKHFTPIPDQKKRSDDFVFMLPNMTSLVNIYARINKFKNGELSDINLYHDEQVQFDKILLINKSLVESIHFGSELHFPHANYDFDQVAKLSFIKSEDCISIQVADLLAGIFMRYTQDIIKGISVAPEIKQSIDLILDKYSGRNGTGVNIVSTQEIVDCFVRKTPYVDFGFHVRKATKVIKSISLEISTLYTMGWVGVISMVVSIYPNIKNSIADIRGVITQELPIIIFHSRENPPKKTILFIPYRDKNGNPYNCRIIDLNKDSTGKVEVSLLSEFSQAFWFLIGNGFLPDPRVGRFLEEKLIEWCGEKLLKL
jgi:hypothetical protein